MKDISSLQLQLPPYPSAPQKPAGTYTETYLLRLMAGVQRIQLAERLVDHVKISFVIVDTRGIPCCDSKSTIVYVSQIDKCCTRLNKKLEYFLDWSPFP